MEQGRGEKALGEQLTGPAVAPPLCSLRLVSSRPLPHELVAGCQGDDAGEGEQQRGGAADAPPAEDDAQVRRVPGEEHLDERGESG